MTKKNKKLKKINKNLNLYPRFEFIVYAENLDPEYADFKNIIEIIAISCNKISNLKSIYVENESSEIYLKFSNGEYLDEKTFDLTQIAFEHCTSVYIFECLKYHDCASLLPFCCFQVRHHSETTFKIKVSSLVCKKSSGATAYFPTKPSFFQYEGKDLELGFSKHAIERFYERCVGDDGGYAAYLIFFKYLNADLRTERAYIYNPEIGKKQISAALLLPLENMFSNEDQVLGMINNKPPIDHKEEQYFWKIGYAPLHVDREKQNIKCGTVLIPGMNGTPECDLISGEEKFIIKDKNKLYTDLPKIIPVEQRQQIKQEFENFKNETNKQCRNPGFQVFCHTMGIPQLVVLHRSITNNHIVSTQSIHNLKIMESKFKNIG